MNSAILDTLCASRVSGHPQGITSVCSANPIVLRATLRHAARTGSVALIEATCNQVNHDGGYTGMRPADFAGLVMRIAWEEGLDATRIVLGGDHLGPNPWRDEPAEVAMRQAETMVAAYAAAGFHKLHLDTSMGCRGEPAAVGDELTASRAARLAAVAEAAAGPDRARLRYVVGTEVPPPGGADHVIDQLEVTAPSAVRKTLDVHREAFLSCDLKGALERILAVVVQPGVEYGNENIVGYDRDAGRELSAALNDWPSLVYEAHSTDYQGASELTDLVEDGFSILKVGPELTFALREALYALDLIASDLFPEYRCRSLKAEMERLMVATPKYWMRHYAGGDGKAYYLRHYSLSDRIRYYWSLPQARECVENLMSCLEGQRIPLSLMWQHMPAAAGYSGRPLKVNELLISRVESVLQKYRSACRNKRATKGAKTEMMEDAGLESAPLR